MGRFAGGKTGTQDLQCEEDTEFPVRRCNDPGSFDSNRLRRRCQKLASRDQPDTAGGDLVVQKTDASVQRLVEMIQSGELRLPEMQRGYVWKGTRVRDLMDSLYRGYPSGNILVWETEESPPIRDMAVGQSVSPFQGFKLLLDGQQRLTSLSAVLRGEPIVVRGRRRPIDILFNLEHPDTLEEVLEVDDDEDNDPEGIDEDDEEDEFSIEERVQKLTFVVSSRRLAALPNWVRISEVFKTSSDAPFLKKVGVTGLDDPRYERYTQRLQRLRQIREYVYSVQILERSMSYDEVTEVFVRVNSLGSKLRSSDLALAQITARWRGALGIIDGFSKDCQAQGFPIQSGTLVRALITQATGQSRFKTVGSVPVPTLKEGWEKAKRGLTFAIHFARNNAGIEDPALLSSPYALLLIGYLAELRGQSLSSEEANLLRLWLQIGNGRGRYSRGSSETYLDQDLNLLRSGRSVGALLDNVRQQFGRLLFDTEEFEGRNQRASVFRLMFQSLKAAGATDWETGIQISTRSYGNEHKLQFHHIFPQVKLRGHYTQAQINEIGNLAFIGGRTNQRIGARLPVEYLPDVVKKRGREALENQCVPMDPALWTLERYPDFLVERRKLLADRVNRYVGEIPAASAGPQ